MIFPACQLAAALRTMRRFGRGRRRHPRLTSTSPKVELAKCHAPLTRDPDLAEIVVVKWWALDQGLRAARGDLALSLNADNLPRPAVTRSSPSTAPAAHRENS